MSGDETMHLCTYSRKQTSKECDYIASEGTPQTRLIDAIVVVIKPLFSTYRQMISADKEKNINWKAAAVERLSFFLPLQGRCVQQHPSEIRAPTGAVQQSG